MKYPTIKDIFERKPSGYTSKLALSTPKSDYTYGTLGNMVSSFAGYIRYHTRMSERQKVLVFHSQGENDLLILLALLKLKTAIIVVNASMDRMALLRIVEMEKPDHCITGMEGFGADLPLPVWLADTRSVEGFEVLDKPAVAAEVEAGICIRLYGMDGNLELTLDALCLRELTSRLDESVAVGVKNSYLIAGDIGLLPFVVETSWCLFRGIPLICYPYSDKLISDLSPDSQRFPMDFSLFFFGSAEADPGEEMCYELLMHAVEHADRYEYSAVWTPERHFNAFGGKYPNPSVLSAAIAARSSKIHIRTGSIVSPLHHVARIAEDWSIIDNISGGRTALSFACGWQCNDFLFYPERYAARHEVMIEQIGQFRKLWAGEKLEFTNGEGGKVTAGIFPRPVQKEMPIWITVSGRMQTFIDAGKAGANILTHLLWQDPSELIPKVRAYRNSLEENGFDPASRTVTVMLHTFLGRSEAEVRKLVEKPLKQYIRSSLNLVEAMAGTVKATQGNNAIGRYGRNDEQMTDEAKNELLDYAFERFLAGASLLGDQAHCQEVLKTLRSYGVDELACLIDFGLDNATILKGLEELRKLKDHYRPSSQKKYAGRFILRSSRGVLLQLMESCPEDVERCGKVVMEDEEGMEHACPFNDQVSLRYGYEESGRQLVVGNTFFEKTDTVLFDHL